MQTEKHPTVNPTVDILLSTYNGERYLREQIDSLINQEYTNWRLLVRDDGSSDSTRDILDEYCPKDSRIKVIESSGNVGVIKSFERLMQSSDADYLMFCDQDDVWQPWKVSHTLEAMQDREGNEAEGTGVIVFTDLCVVDKELHTIHESFWNLSWIRPALLDSFKTLCVYPSATGCTMMLNKAAKANVKPFVPEVRMHDSWITLCNAKAGGKLQPLYEKTILYRQHGNNVVGAQDNQSYLRKKITNLRKVFKENKAQRNMIKQLGFTSLFQYIYYKTRYTILSRI